MNLIVMQRIKAPGQLMAMQIQPTLLERIKEAQGGDPKLQEFRKQVEVGLRTNMQIYRWNTLFR